MEEEEEEEEKKKERKKDRKNERKKEEKILYTCGYETAYTKLRLENTEVMKCYRQMD